jgi:hypothetical protein
MNMNMETLARVLEYKGAIDAVNAALPAILTDEEKKAAAAEREAIRDTTANAVRDYVEATAELDPAEAATILRIGLELLNRPSGTCKNYGRAVQGFRKLREANPEGWREASVRDAQDAMRSSEQVKLDAAKETLRPYLKAAKLAQIEALVEFAKGLGIVLPVKGTKGDSRPVADKPSHGEQISRAA